MSTYIITKENTSLKGAIQLTASKSESNRALIIQALCTAPFQIENLAAAKDTETMKELLASDETTLDVGPAGTTMRFLTAFLSLQTGERILTGSQRMKERPIGILVDALRDLGAQIEYTENDGFPPLKITGKPLEGGTITMDGSVSSQFITAILLIAPSLKNGVTIQFKGEVASRPYLDMTLNIMRHFGALVQWKDNSIVVSPKSYEAKNFTVEADWSAASYWYQMAAFANDVDVKINGLKPVSLQGDSVLQDIYTHFGITSTFYEGGVHLQKENKQLIAFDYDFDDCPDIAQTLAVTCAGLKIKGHLSGLKSLRIKETDRSLAIQTELKKFGIDVELHGDDALTVFEGELKTGEAVATYHDHRMAMAFAPLAQVLPSVIIENPMVVEKSYPAYYEDLKTFDFKIEE